MIIPQLRIKKYSELNYERNETIGKPTRLPKIGEERSEKVYETKCEGVKIAVITFEGVPILEEMRNEVKVYETLKSLQGVFIPELISVN